MAEQPTDGKDNRDNPEGLQQARGVSLPPPEMSDVEPPTFSPEFTDVEEAVTEEQAANTTNTTNTANTSSQAALGPASPPAQFVQPVYHPRPDQEEVEVSTGVSMAGATPTPIPASSPTSPTPPTPEPQQPEASGAPSPTTATLIAAATVAAAAAAKANEGVSTPATDAASDPASHAEQASPSMPATDEPPAPASEPVSSDNPAVDEDPAPLTDTSVPSLASDAAFANTSEDEPPGDITETPGTEGDFDFGDDSFAPYEQVQGPAATPVEPYTRPGGMYTPGAGESRTSLASPSASPSPMSVVPRSVERTREKVLSPAPAAPSSNRALLVAALALVLSLISLLLLTGLLPFSYVGDPQVKDSAINSQQVQDASLQARDLAPNAIQAGAAGPIGPDGPAGKSGRRGRSGPRGRSGEVGAVRYVSADAGANGRSKRATARCPRGQSVLGGGASVTGSGGALTANNRSGAGWTGSASPLPRARGQFGLQVTAICARTGK